LKILAIAVFLTGSFKLHNIHSFLLSNVFGRMASSIFLSVIFFKTRIVTGNSKWGLLRANSKHRCRKDVFLSNFSFVVSSKIAKFIAFCNFSITLFL